MRDDLSLTSCSFWGGSQDVETIFGEEVLLGGSERGRSVVVEEVKGGVAPQAQH
jgi:hypothetical protein